MMAMDGNNSLKNMARSREVDQRAFDSGYYLSPAFVNKYANEVRSRKEPKEAEPAATDQPVAEVPPVTQPSPTAVEPPPPDASLDDEPPGLIEDVDAASASPPSKCTEKWKAAADDNKKRMWSIFNNAGIFASACRHGLILWIIDMIMSGEL